MKLLKVTVLLVSLFFIPAFKLATAETITNDTIVAMVKAGLGEELISSKIETSQNTFDVSTESIIKLKKEGVSETIIKTMLDASTKQATPEQKTLPTANPGESSDSGEKAPAIEKEEKESETTSATAELTEENVYYARCNLKVIKGDQITWVNWQSTPTFIPVNTKLKVIKSGSKASVVNVETGSHYTLDIGERGDKFLEKFVTKKPVGINRFTADVQSNIKNTVARIGMTKQEVYIAMGPPTNVVNVRSNTKTYDDIMGADLWVYARKRFGKNIGVAFDPGTGRVSRTEGIWR
ncbi:MAG TPA: hypothetical protein VJ440_10890 [Candidatus Brocadiaceae bacterium]|nr:hypothetical protein [Candidatus Brocadiaceae bacterium]